jgi:hypothetical protein
LSSNKKLTKGKLIFWPHGKRAGGFAAPSKSFAFRESILPKFKVKLLRLPFNSRLAESDQLSVEAFF